MKQLNGISKIFNGIVSFFKTIGLSYFRKTNFKKNEIILYFLVGLFVCSSAIFLSSGIKVLSTKNTDYISYCNEVNATRNGTNIINYSFNNENEERPMCNTFVNKTFGINVGPYSLDHSIYCYAMLNDDSGGIVNYQDKVISDCADLVFISDLGYFFDKKTEMINNSIFEFSSSYIRVSVSENIARKVLGLDEGQEIIVEDLSNTFFKLTYRGKTINCLIYSLIRCSSSYYHSLFSDDFICIHDTEESVSNFSRIISMPCGRYRNSEVLSLFVDKGYSFNDFSTFIMKNNEKTIIDNGIHLNEFEKTKTIYLYLIFLAIALVIACILVLIFANYSFINCCSFGFIFLLLIDIIRFIILSFSKITSIFVFSASSFYSFLILLACFAITYLVRKAIFRYAKKG